MGYAVKAGADRTALGDRNGAYCRVDHNKNKHSLKEKGKDAVVYVKVVMPEVDAPIHGDGGAGDSKKAPPPQHAAMLGAQTPEIQAVRQTLAAADNSFDAARLLVEHRLQVAEGDILHARTRADRHH